MGDTDGLSTNSDWLPGGNDARVTGKDGLPPSNGGCSIKGDGLSSDNAGRAVERASLLGRKEGFPIAKPPSGIAKGSSEVGKSCFLADGTALGAKEPGLSAGKG